METFLYVVFAIALVVAGYKVFVRRKVKTPPNTATGVGGGAAGGSDTGDGDTLIQDNSI